MKLADIANAQPAREGDVFLIVIPNYWSRSPTIADAIKGLTKQSGRRSHKEWLLYSVHKETYCEECMGDLISPKDHRPILLATHKGLPAKR